MGRCPKTLEQVFSLGVMDHKIKISSKFQACKNIFFIFKEISTLTKSFFVTGQSY